MPRKKKAEDIPLESNVELSSEDGAASAINTDDTTDTEASEKEAVKEAPKKRRTRKKTEEVDLEDVSQTAKTDVSTEISDDSIDKADELTDIHESSDKPELVETEVDTVSKEKDAAALARQLKRMRDRRILSSNDGADETSEYDDGDYSQEATSDTDISPVIQEAAEFFGFSGQKKELDINEENIIWNEIRRYRITGIPILCRVVGVKPYKKQISAVCKPIDKRFDIITVFVPFSEMDFREKVHYSNKQKRLIIEIYRLNIVQRVSILHLDEKNGYCEGSIRLGNYRTRKDAYFLGVEGSINNNSTYNKRLIIGKGTIVKGQIEQISRDGILVNIYGARTWIKRNELSYEYIAHPRKYYKIGQSVRVKILKLTTDKDNHYSVTISASIKALMVDNTISALKKWASIGHSYPATIAFLPRKDSHMTSPMAFADLGFNIVIGTVLTKAPFTVGSKVLIKLRAINNTFAFGDVIRVLEYYPQRFD